MESINNAVSWYQQKIGYYDKQLWEHSVEQKVIRGIQNIPKKNANLKPELIDVDLVRGSTFSKAKPQHTWPHIAKKGIMRVLFLPFYVTWWKQQTSGKFVALLMILYFLQVAATIVYFVNQEHNYQTFEVVSICEVLSPIVLMVFLGTVHSQIISTHISHKGRKLEKKSKRKSPSRKKKTRSKYTSSSRDSASQDTVGDEGSAPRVKRRTSPNSVRFRINPTQGRRLLVDKAVGPDTDEADDASDNESNLSISPEISPRARPRYNNQPYPMPQIDVTVEDADKSQQTPTMLANSSSDFPGRDKNVGESNVTNAHTNADSCKTVQNLPDLSINTKSTNTSPKKDQSIRNFPNYIPNPSQETTSIMYNLPTRSAVGQQTVDTDSTENDEDEISQKLGKRYTSNSTSRKDSKSDLLKKQGHLNPPPNCDEKSDSTSDQFEVVSADQLVYKNLDGEETGWNTLEGPLTMDFEPTGELLMPDSFNQFDINGIKIATKEGLVTDDSEHGAVGGTSEVKGHKISYIPSEREQEMGNINLQGISERKAFGQNRKTSQRNHTSDTVNDTTEDSTARIAPELSKKVPDPILPLSNQHTVQGSSNGEKISELESEEDLTVPITTVGPVRESEDADNEIDGTDNNIEHMPSSEQEFGRIDLVGIKKRHTLGGSHGNVVRRRRKSNQKLESIVLDQVPTGGATGATKGRGKGRPDTLMVKIRENNRTGLSSCDSEVDNNTPNTPGYHKKWASGAKHGESSVSSTDGQMSEIEWEDNMHSEMATSDSSSAPSESSDLEEESPAAMHDDPFSGVSTVGTVLQTQPSDKVSCVLWEGDDCKKLDLTTIDIGWAIIEKVDSLPETSDYITLAILFASLLAVLPTTFRLYFAEIPLMNYNMYVSPQGIHNITKAAFGSQVSVVLVVIAGSLQRLVLGFVFFFLLSVAERTFKQRLLYAKHFCFLTSTRRARKYDLPHFRLNKVRNIKTWLSLRSYLKKRGPQRSVDVIVSAAFLLAITMVVLMCIQLLRDSDDFPNHYYNWELLVWFVALSIYLLRFMTLGSKINKKYRHLSVLITEQINLYLHMEQKPHKKEELMLANNVLKLAQDLFKELESPFKISGLSANPYLFTITRVIVLSAFSAVLTELLGFKLKLYNLKIKT